MPLEAPELTAFAKAHRGLVTLIGLNVRIENDLKAVAARLNRSIDILVCNAGVLIGRGGVRDAAHSAIAVEEALSTNVAGVFFTVQHFLPPSVGRRFRAWVRYPWQESLSFSSQMASSTCSGSNAMIYRASRRQRPIWRAPWQLN